MTELSINIKLQSKKDKIRFRRYYNIKININYFNISNTFYT